MGGGGWGGGGSGGGRATSAGEVLGFGVALGDPKEAYGGEHIVGMVDDDGFVEHLPGFIGRVSKKEKKWLVVGS